MGPRYFDVGPLCPFGPFGPLLYTSRVTSIQKLLATLGFLAILLILGTADALLTGGTLRMPASAGVVKQSGPDVLALLQARGFVIEETNEDFLLQAILPPGTPLTSRVLLQNNDRVAALAWIDSPDVKRSLATLRGKLHASFSPDLRDLIDETQSQLGKPPRDLLSFSDPTIHSERIVFARVRQRLYEFHVRDGKEKEIDSLVDAFTE